MPTPGRPLEATTLPRVDGLAGDPADIVVRDTTPSPMFKQFIEELSPAWHRASACRGSGVSFFPTRGESHVAAVALCQTCPVRRTSLAEAIADPTLDHGIRGGLTVRQRQARRQGAA